MKSPLTGKEMALIKEPKEITYRKSIFTIIHHGYFCEDSNEMFTTTEIDQINMYQIYSQYRDKHNIPFPDEIRAIRDLYGISASKMSEILGLGTNSYRQYEAGEMPSTANARLIQIVIDPKKFRDIVNDLWETEKSKEKLINKIDGIISEYKKKRSNLTLYNYFLGSHLADIFSGYKNPNFEKFTEMVVFFTEKLKPYKTKMNKLLFYADFLMFQKRCSSISGVRYRAIPLGPVPNNFQSIFEYLANNDVIDLYYEQLPTFTTEQFFPNEKRKFNASLFGEQELDVLQSVAGRFKKMNANEIVDHSHLESAWLKNKTERKIISYNYAFDLNPI